MKTWLDIGEELEDFVSVVIDAQIVKLLQLTNIPSSELETNEKIQTLILYGSIIDFNKRFNEGINIDISGAKYVQVAYDSYESLLVSTKRMKTPYD